MNGPYKERPLMTSDFRVGRGVQNDPQNRTSLLDVPLRNLNFKVDRSLKCPCKK